MKSLQTTTPGHITPSRTPARWRALTAWFPTLTTQQLGQRRERLGDPLLVKKVVA